MVWDPRKTLDEIVSGTKKAGGSISEGVRKGDLKKIGRGISEAYKATPMSQGERQLVKSAEKLDPYGDVHEKKRKAEAEAEEAARRAAGRFEDIEAPTGDPLLYNLPDELAFEELTLQGYTPEEAEAVLAGESKFGDISTDPRFAEAQMQSLEGIQDIVESGGMTAGDVANLSRVQSDVARADRGRREAIQDRMRRQGMTGSGLDMLAQLQSGQAATDRASQAGLDIAGMAQDRQRQAILDQAQMATGLRGQSFDEQAQAAAAQDAIARFNAANQQSAMLANQAAANQAAQFGAQAGNQAALFNRQAQMDTDKFNLQNRQATDQANIDAQNRARQQAFQNQMQLGSARADADLGFATTQQQAADRASRERAGINEALLKGAGAATQAVVSDENKKTEIAPLSDNDVTEFLDSLQPKQFKYKDPNNGEGQRIGVMAQDIEPTKMGAAIVQDTPNGKVLDNGNTMGAILDSLSVLNKKQKEIEDSLPPIMITGGP